MKNLFNNNLKKRIFTSFALIFLIFLIFYFYSILIYSLIIITVISIIEFLSISKKIIKSRLNLYVINIFFIIYVSTFSIMFFYFSTFRISNTGSLSCSARRSVCELQDLFCSHCSLKDDVASRDRCFLKDVQVHAPKMSR